MAAPDLHQHDLLVLDDPVLFHVLSGFHLVHPNSGHVGSEDKQAVVGRSAAVVAEGVGTKTPGVPW